MSRRSANRTAPRKRYTIDAFEGLPELQDTEGEENNIPPDGDASSDDFQDNAEPSADEDDGDDAMSGVEEEAAEASDAGERDLDDNISTVGDTDMTNLPRTKKAFIKPKPTPAEAAEKVYTRGLDEIQRNTSWLSRRLLFFGPLREDYAPVSQARARWIADPTLPRRKVDAKGLGGYHPSYYQSEEDRKKEALDSRKWYHEDGGKRAFQERQSIHALSAEEADMYSPVYKTTMSFVMGPLDDQKVFHLRLGESMPLSNAWAPEEKSQGSAKRGAMLNLGAKVNCLAWAPGRAGQDQYLAAAVVPERPAANQDQEQNTAPAFTAQPPFRSNIQFWRVRAGEENTIDSAVPLRLKLVLCTEWGDIKSIKWCPVPAADSGTLGLLAVLSGDGAVRVVDVPLPEEGQEMTFLRVDEVAFKSQPPGTLCTCITWTTASRIAAGCANGFLSVWDLPAALSTSSSNPRPVLYAPVSTTYILAISACYPSRPYMVLTTSMAGYVTLTDMRHAQPASPESTANSQRSRMGQTLLVWHDYMQTAMSMDDLYTLRMFPLRRFFNIVSAARMKGIGTAIAASPCHPCMLMGTANGEVVATNPVARITDTRVDTWQQTWFQHEWRRPNAEEVAESMDRAQTTGAAGSIAENGLSRFLDGFKAETVRVSNEQREMANAKEGVLFHTIHEKETAITALSWNPNLEFGGWAAAGMADGLVRIEDIGLQ